MKYILGSAIVLAAVLLSGFATINIYHNLKIPSLDSARISTYHSYDLNYPFVHKVISIRLNDSIKSINSYKDVAEAISEADSGDTVKMYLAGYGGQVDGAMYIINALSATKAHTETHVQAPVYSAHAYIALYGKQIYVSSNSYLMLHSSSVIEVDCSKQTGNDRGITKKESCENFKAAALFSNYLLLNNSNKLSNGEIYQIMTGKEVYIFANSMKERGAIIE
jgi:ATP-dependent protease ClpP protease subunit